ncbi:hypothetical protein PROFUN_15535 [Planoprotostelium fungivorum]|uniref:Secreted protein n=1 Tax=Planoprotostelium fungivorum TaxID=1890364 RepID=A0A2P6MUR5_9EUKA|nr:hypothetical protein PROFUN_15535 [Planoprotostelium fungivorum]
MIFDSTTFPGLWTWTCAWITLLLIKNQEVCVLVQWADQRWLNNGLFCERERREKEEEKKKREANKGMYLNTSTTMLLLVKECHVRAQQ